MQNLPISLKSTTKNVEEKSMYTIIHENNKRSQMLIYSLIWFSNPKILCSQMLVFTLNPDSRNYSVHRCWFSPKFRIHKNIVFTIFSSTMKTRKSRKYNVSGNTKLFMTSLILYMKRLINKNMQKYEEEKTKSFLYLWKWANIGASLILCGYSQYFFPSLEINQLLLLLLN